VRQQSHINDMREAIRGDLERARSRRPSIFERPAAPPAVADDPEPTLEPERIPEPEPVAEQKPRSEPAPPPELPSAAAAPPSERRVRDRLAFWRR
jgi:hypothetical protein